MSLGIVLETGLSVTRIEVKEGACSVACVPVMTEGHNCLLVWGSLHGELAGEVASLLPMSKCCASAVSSFYKSECCSVQN